MEKKKTQAILERILKGNLNMDCAEKNVDIKLGQFKNVMLLRKLQLLLDLKCLFT